MGLDNPLHIAFLLVLLLLVFGAKRLPEMGRSLGEGLRGFKSAVSGEPIAHAIAHARSRTDGHACRPAGGHPRRAGDAHRRAASDAGRTGAGPRDEPQLTGVHVRGTPMKVPVPRARGRHSAARAPLAWASSPTRS